MTLEELEARRATRLDPRDLPHATTQREATAYATDTAALDARIVTAKSAMAALSELADDADTPWLVDLNTWRKVLCDELLTIKSPIRDRAVMGRNVNLTLSIRTIDFGLGQLRDSGYELSTLALGGLMRDSGYEVIGADPSRNFAGRMPWFGSIKEVEQRLKATAKRRAQAEQQLASALLDDDVRETQEAQSKRLRDAYNALDVRVGPNATLRVFGRDNQEVSEATLTELQREALAKARAAFSETVAS